MIYVMLADGFEEIEALTVVDVLRRAKLEARMVSCHERQEVTGAHNISVRCDEMLSACEIAKTDMVVLPGGMPGTLNLLNNPKVISFLEEAMKAEKEIAAICAAPMILGRMGWLKGKNATSYPGFENDLEGAAYREDRVVHDGAFTTSRGPGTALEFALSLVRILKDDQTALKLANDMIVKG